MKVLETPHSVARLLEVVGEERLAAVLAHSRPVVEGRYLHWDNLRHRRPPAGLSAHEWWLGIRLSRAGVAEEMPLVDKGGAPFSLVHIPSIRRRLHDIDQKLGRAGQPSDVQAMVDTHGRRYLLTNSLIEEAIRSSQLEGASTTRAKAKDMIREGRRPRDKSERMILNNFAAMERIEELADRALTGEAVFELHCILVDGTLDDAAKAGTYRTGDDKVVVELIHSIETAHVPPPAGELPGRMERLLAFANGTTPEDWLHPVLRSIILHFMVGFDHPFVDGNGRVARALFYWCLLHHGYSLARFLSISRVLREAPATYARAYLHTETDGGDLTYFVDHQLDVLGRSIAALSAHISRKVSETEALEAEVRARHDLNHRQVELLEHAIRNPGFEYTVRSHETLHRVVTNTARADLVDLAAKGILVKSKRGRAHVFIAPRDIKERLNRPFHPPAARG